MTEREFAVDVVRRLRVAGHEALFAGGCVRDELLAMTPKDYDVATSARPEAVQALFRRTVAVGEAFGVVEVLGPRPHKIQVATFRHDLPYHDGRHPEGVVFCGAEEDAKRRDFTINGMFMDPLDGSVIDYVGGRADLDARVLRAIGDAPARFREDYLRMLRAVRMAARFGLEIDPATAEAVRAMAPRLGNGVSAERIADELRKMLSHPRRARAVALLHELALTPVVLPEMDARGVLPHLEEDAGFELSMASLLRGETRSAADRLKLANHERERIAWLASHRTFLGEDSAMRPARLKPLLVHPGFAELAALARAEARAAGRSESAIDEVLALRAKWEAEGTLDPPPLLTGTDLIESGMVPGPRFKALLTRVREAQLDGAITTRDEAMALAQTGEGV